MNYECDILRQEVCKLSLRAGIEIDRCLRIEPNDAIAAVQSLLQVIRNSLTLGSPLEFQLMYDLYRCAIAPVSSSTLKSTDDLIAAIAELSSGWERQVREATSPALGLMLKTSLDMHRYCLDHSPTWSADQDTPEKFGFAA